MNLDAFLAELQADESPGPVEHFALPDRMPMREQRPWIAWLGHHGIEPALVCLGGYIERDPGRRQIRYLGMELLEPPKGGRYTFRLTDDRRDVYKSEHVVQLESVPSPFPV